MTAYFITATGTGIGKTFTTCALVHASRGRGFKPVISGWDGSNAMDTMQIIEAGGGVQTVEEVSPWRFAAPLSPHRAAALEEKAVDRVALEAWCRAQREGDALTLVETAGGVMTPITEHHTMLDLMAALQWPVILVAGSYLGTISHTLTAIDVLRARGLAIKALVLCESEGSAVALDEAWAGLAPFLVDIALQVTQPLVSSYREATEIHQLAGWL